jgi:hypothetical protein
MAIKGVRLTEEQKEMIVQCVYESGGILTQASRLAKVALSTVYNVLEDERFENILEDARKERMDRLVGTAEDKILDKIKDGDTPCIIYTLRTQGKNRGWEQKDINNREPLTIRIKQFDDKEDEEKEEKETKADD